MLEKRIPTSFTIDPQVEHQARVLAANLRISKAEVYRLSVSAYLENFQIKLKAERVPAK